MSASRTRAVAALERWRNFQQARAALAHGQARRVAQAAADAFEAARDAVAQTQRQRSSLLSADVLDVPRWQAVAAIEDHLWRDAEEHRQRLAAARDGEDAARLRHRHAHAMTEVAEKRHDRLATDAEASAEKSTFDRLADLRTRATETPR